MYSQGERKREEGEGLFLIDLGMVRYCREKKERKFSSFEVHGEAAGERTGGNGKSYDRYK